jgi:hypothetical protein
VLLTGEDKIVLRAIWQSPTVVIDARQHPRVVVKYRGNVTDADIARHLESSARPCSDASAPP